MFCQSNFITNKIFAFLNASIDWSKKIVATETTLMRLQYSLIVSVQHNGNLGKMLYVHVAKIVWIILI